MNSIKKSLVFIAFFAVYQALGFGMPSHFERFLKEYKDVVIDQRTSSIAPAWVYEAINALRADGIIKDLKEPGVVNNVSTFLWRNMENVANYYAALPQNRNNPDFKARVWQSLTRSVDELARIQPPVQPQAPVQRPVQPQTPVQQTVSRPVLSGAAAGVEALSTFRKQTSQIIQSNPAYFYSAGYVQQSWLREALRSITANGKEPLTLQNRMNMQEEIASTATELMRQILRNDPRNLSEQQKNNIISMIRAQIEQFIEAQLPSGNQYVSVDPNQGLAIVGASALKTFRAETSQIIQKSPSFFYAGGVIQAAWLQEALKRITANGQIVLTMQNKTNIQEEIISTATELMHQLMRNDQRLMQQKSAILQTIRGQIEQFINGRVMRSRI